MAFSLKQKNRGLVLVVAALILSLGLSAGVKAEAYCSDGKVDPGEECDDGNHIDRDGCSAYCRIEDLDPPVVESVSIPDGSENVHTLTAKVEIVFSEPLDPQTVSTQTVKIKNAGCPLNADVSLSDDEKTVVVELKEDLIANSEHAIMVANIKDVSGNTLTETILSVFTAGDAIDHNAPNPVAFPTGGNYTVAQSVTLKAYLGSYTGSDEFLDPDATIYYTFEGIPTEKSPKYERPLTVERNRTLRFLSVDKTKNKSPVKTEIYRFACPEMPNAIETTLYPTCRVIECKYGFNLKGNVCIANLGGIDPNDYRVNSVTAPLFASDTPSNISSKPALFITPKHNGVIPRPVLFQEQKRGTTIRFERDTKITSAADGELFSGYILAPENLYTKDFPIHFGYSFKSIFRFEAAEEKGDLIFSPPIQITVPYTDGFDAEEGVTVFTYNPKTEQYLLYPEDRVTVDLAKKEVALETDSTGTFFVAQSGKNFNRAIFKDTEGHWSQNYVEALYRKAVVKGRDKDIFAPNENLTRAEFVKVALNAAGIETDAEAKEAPFEDVPLYSWYAPFIAKAKALGLVGGYNDGTFKPDQPILRVEAVHILMKAFGFDTVSSDPKDKSTDEYRDIRKSEWYFPSVRFAIQKNLIKGRRSKEGAILPTFGPDRPITRGEMAELTIKAIEFKEEK